MATIFGALFIAVVAIVAFAAMSLIHDALNSCIRAADALERIADALEDDEEMEVSDDES